MQRRNNSHGITQRVNSSVGRNYVILMVVNFGHMGVTGYIFILYSLSAKWFSK